MKTLDQIKGEMLLTDEQLKDSLKSLYEDPQFIEDVFLKSKSEMRVAAQAQHDWDMHTVINKGGVCEKCGGSKMGIYYFNRKAPCDTCKGTGTVDITVRDAINKVGGDG